MFESNRRNQFPSVSPMHLHKPEHHVEVTIDITVLNKATGESTKQQIKANSVMMVADEIIDPITSLINEDDDKGSKTVAMILGSAGPESIFNAVESFEQLIDEAYKRCPEAFLLKKLYEAMGTEPVKSTVNSENSSYTGFLNDLKEIFPQQK